MKATSFSSQCSYSIQNCNIIQCQSSSCILLGDVKNFQARSPQTVRLKFHKKRTRKLLRVPDSTIWCARAESNCRLQLRRLTSYPLDYERVLQASNIIAYQYAFVQSFVIIPLVCPRPIFQALPCRSKDRSSIHAQVPARSSCSRASAYSRSADNG